MAVETMKISSSRTKMMPSPSEAKSYVVQGDLAIKLSHPSDAIKLSEMSSSIRRVGVKRSFITWITFLYANDFLLICRRRLSIPNCDLICRQLKIDDARFSLCFLPPERTFPKKIVHLGTRKRKIIDFFSTITETRRHRNMQVTSILFNWDI
jgi:hypothetical protein